MTSLAPALGRGRPERSLDKAFRVRDQTPVDAYALFRPGEAVPLDGGNGFQEGLVASLALPAAEIAAQLCLAKNPCVGRAEADDVVSADAHPQMLRP